MPENIYKLGENAEARFIRSDRFNTTYLSFHFYLPLSSETMAADALLPYLLTSCSEEYRSFTKLNTELLKLYGAELSCSVSKSGDWLHSKISINVINDCFAYGDERIVAPAAGLLTSLIFRPAVENMSFFDADLEREKRKTVERIEGEINNKRSFARTQLVSLMFPDEPFGRFVYGQKAEVEALTGKEMYNAWQRLLENSFIQFNIVGRELPDGVFDEVSTSLAAFDRTESVVPDESRPLRPTEQINRRTDRMQVTQGKLAMGFSSELFGGIKEALPLMIFADIFGGGPYSRLFSNVREKQSLCYYCSASQRRSKGYVTVDSGIEFENAEKAEAAILHELSEIQNGNVDDTQLESSKSSVIDSLGSYYDNAAALDMWYTRDICGDSELTPDDVIGSIEKITKQDVVNTAKGVRLHSVYLLLGETEADK